MQLYLSGLSTFALKRPLRAVAVAARVTLRTTHVSGDRHPHARPDHADQSDHPDHQDQPLGSTLDFGTRVLLKRGAQPYAVRVSITNEQSTPVRWY